MDADLPKHINYWMTSSSKHDCFFNVGPESGPKERIGAIKILLIGHSEVLQKMLDESPLAEMGDISITDSDPDNFRNFLICIYGGTDIIVRQLSYEKCLSLLYLCEKYLTLDIKEKISLSILQLYQPLSIDHVLMSLSSPSCLANTSNNLFKAITKAIQNDTDKILNHKSFLNLDSNAIIFIVKLVKISTKEVNLWKAVLNWAQEKIDSEDSKEVRSCLENILKHIRFSTMESNDFCTSVVPSRVLTPEEVFEICISIGTKSIPKLNGLSCEILNRFKSQTQSISFTYVFNNVKEFTGSINSTSVELGGFNWYNFLRRADDKDNLEMFLVCSSLKNTSFWKCLAKFEFVVVNHSCGPNLTQTSAINEFSKKNDSWGFKKLYSFKDLLNIQKGYIKNNAVEIVTHVELQPQET